MDTADIIKYYVDLLILQYVGKDRARAHIDALISQIVADQIYKETEEAFDIDTAVGEQLDIIGKYVGVERSAQGNEGNINLTEPDYRILIKIAIIKNNFGSTLFEIQQLLDQFFAGEIFVFDYLDMRMSYFINSDAWSNELVQMMVIQDLLPYPLTVQRGAIVYFPVLNAFFGFRTYTAEGYNNTPFNDYDDYQMDWPWLSYNDAISPDDVQEYSLLTEVDLDVIVQENLDKMYYT